MTHDEIKTIIEKFLNDTLNGKRCPQKSPSNDDEWSDISPIYNEFSLQHELGTYIKKEVDAETKVEYERHRDYFTDKDKDKPAKKGDKKEIDITVYNKEEPLIFIELKFPRNGQVPVQLYSFCKDIQFLEQLNSLAAATDNTNAFFVALINVDDKGSKSFIMGERKSLKPIYTYFRKEGKFNYLEPTVEIKVEINGVIENPIRTNKDEDEDEHKVTLRGKYNVTWKRIKESNFYYIILPVTGKSVRNE